MPILDTPVDFGSAGLSDTPVTEPILPPKAPLADDLNNVVTFQAAQVKSTNDGTPLFDAFQAIDGNADSEQELKRQAQLKVNQDEQDFNAAYLENPGLTAQDAKENYTATQELVSGLDRQVKNPDLAFVKSLTQGQANPTVEQEMASQLSLAKLMRQTWDGMSKAEVAGNALAMMIPGNTVYGNMHLTGHVSAEDYLRNLVLNYKNLDPQTQVEMQPQIVKELTEGLGNKLKVITVLQAMLSPAGEEDLGQFNKLWATLDVATVASLGASIGAKVFKLTKGLNAVRMASSNAKTAADIESSAAISEEVAKKANMARATTVADVATGINPADDVAYTGGLSTETLKRLDTFSSRVAKVADELKKGDLYLQEGLLQQQERDAAETHAINQLYQQPAIENIRVTNRTPVSTEFTYDTVNADGQPVQAKYNLDLTLNDVGEYEQSEVGVLSRFFTSNDVWAKGNLRDTVKQAIRLDSANARVLNQLTDLQQTAVKDILGPLGLKGITPVGRKALAQIDEVLRVGDESAKVYTPLELKAGVNGVKLDDKQIEAYYKIRSLVDSLHYLRNSTKREEFILKGFKNVNIDDTTQAIARPFANASDAKASIRDSNANLVYRQDTNDIAHFTDTNLDTMYDKGMRLVRLQEPTEFPTSTGVSEKVYYALVDDKSVTELPDIVLPYREGYVPKINDRASYFVKEYSATRIDGIDIGKNDPRAQVTTIRAFDNKDDAQLFAEQMQAKNPKHLYRALEDRQIEKERRAVGAGGPGSGGLYTGARAEEDIPFGLDGLPPERINSFEAISRNLANLSKYISRNTWRMGNEERALNTAKRLIPQGRWESFSDLALAPDTEAGRLLRKMHQQIEEWMGFPTKEEQLWTATVQSIYDSVGATKFMPGFAKKGLRIIRTKDPIAAARAAAFHSLLGWFNPVQLWVQAQGAAIALSANILDLPELTNVIRIQQALALADHMESAEGVANVAKGLGMKAEELAVLKAAWRKSGLRDSILTTADYAASARGRGIAMDAIKRASDKGLLFYRIGELFNRRVSFVTAFREWQKANVGAVLDDTALKGILTRSNDYMLNLTKANRAAWQKGILSLPTQFLQVSTKGMETILGVIGTGNRNFTRVEAGKLLLGQFLLYGAAGIPLGTIGINWLAQQLGVSQADLENSERYTRIRKLANEGFTGWATMAMFGVDVDIGQRSSLANGINQTLDNWLFADSNIASAFLGAFGSTGTRFWDGFTNLMQPLSLGLGGVTKVDAYKAAVLLAEPVSTFRNVSKAIFMHNFNRIVTKNGRTVIARDFTTREEIAQAIGFRLSDEVQVRQLNDIIKAKRDYEADVTNAIVNVYWDYSKGIKYGTISPEEQENTRQKIALLIQSLDTNYERQRVRQNVQDILTNGTDERSQAWREIRKMFINGQIDYLTSWHNKLTADGILQEHPVLPNQEEPKATTPTQEEPQSNVQPLPDIKGPRKFVDNLTSSADQAARQLGVDRDILLAQAALETGWGKHVSHNDLFGIKGQGSAGSSEQSTSEYVNGKKVTVKAKFRAYDSYSQSFNDYVNFIKSNPRYQEALQKAHNPEEYVKALQDAGYATDPKYAEKILSIYKRIKSGEH